VEVNLDKPADNIPGWDTIGKDGKSGTTGEHPNTGSLWWS
jgi:hypothetical protein